MTLSQPGSSPGPEVNIPSLTESQTMRPTIMRARQRCSRSVMRASSAARSCARDRRVAIGSASKPAETTAATSASGETPSADTRALESARLTEASTTPSTDCNAFSTCPTQEEQCIPSIESRRVASFPVGCGFVSLNRSPITVSCHSGSEFEAFTYTGQAYPPWPFMNSPDARPPLKC